MTAVEAKKQVNSFKKIGAGRSCRHSQQLANSGLLKTACQFGVLGETHLP